MADSTTKVLVKVIKPSDASLPSLVLQITKMVDTYMLWIGVADSNANPVDGKKTVLNGNLCKDWACAMPPKAAGAPSSATSLFRSSSSDAALPMAQRLAKRFQKQIFLSVDIPVGFLSMGQGQRLVLEAERGIVTTLKELETIGE